MRLNWIYKIITLLLWGMVMAPAGAISPELLNDLALIEARSHQATAKAQKARSPQRHYLVDKDDPLSVKINPAYHVFGGLLYFYQTSLSRQFSADCLYEPTCSSFSMDVIAHYGTVKGLALTADRLCRCNRIAQTDLHPLSINEKTLRSRDSYQIYRHLHAKPGHENCDHQTFKHE